MWLSLADFVSIMGMYACVAHYSLKWPAIQGPEEGLGRSKCMKRILVLVSSPRKGGNSEMLCDEFIRGAKEAGHEIEKVSLSAKKIGYCSGCGACQASHACVKKDDMAAILERMIGADAIVLSTPRVFLHDVRADEDPDRQVRRAIHRDRGQGLLFHRDRGPTPTRRPSSGTIEEFRGFTACLEGATEKGIVYGTGAWEAGSIAGSPAVKRAYELGKKA